uniref:Short neurotoxin 1 n=1 Tax=Naja philippinensis TaxID=8659 RepID=3S11_NAJPH|nr:RecName: Full=Short neurotoxin 1; Short=NTX I [Naja philippinensis]
LECHNQQSSQAPTTKTCSGETNCYKKWWSDHRGTIIERGCGCPKVKPGVKLNCCRTDRCNN